jgi:hypothetical protein
MVLQNSMIICMYPVYTSVNITFFYSCPGIQTAMRHDTIMEGGYADYVLVEGEAQRVAKEAVQALKESRRECWQADVGVPSWTGQSGALRSPSISAAQVR